MACTDTGSGGGKSQQGTETSNSEPGIWRDLAVIVST